MLKKFIVPLFICATLLIHGDEVQRPLVPESIKSEIKESARAKWPDNYEMQVFHYENNIEAWQTIEMLKKALMPEATNEAEKKLNKQMSGIFKRAVEKWPKNYEMQLFQIKNQIEAYMKMEGVE